MKNSLLILILVVAGFCSCGRKSNFATSKVAKDNDSQLSLIHDIEKSSGYTYIDTDTTYTFSNGKGITIQNGYPKGGNIEPGIPYIDSTGKQYFFVAFWTRIINGTNTAVEFKVNFTADSFPFSASPDPYVKLIIPTDTMTIDKLPLYSYGLTEMKAFVDANWDKATTLQKTIKPKEEHIFYTVALAYKTGGPARSAIFLKEDKLYYRISMRSHSPLIIPCGEIVFKNENPAYK